MNCLLFLSKLFVKISHQEKKKMSDSDGTEVYIFALCSTHRQYYYTDLLVNTNVDSGFSKLMVTEVSKNLLKIVDSETMFVTSFTKDKGCAMWMSSISLIHLSMYVTKNYENSLNNCTGICFLSSEISAANDAPLLIYPSTKLKSC